MNGAEEIWTERARRFGRRAAVNLSISDKEIDDETRRVQALLFPLLGQELTAPPLRLLDYGCGWGRFTADLAAYTGATDTIGFDPCADLIAMVQTPAASNVRFVTGSPRDFFRGLQAPFHLIWIHGVLGGLDDTALPEVAGAICSALAPNGLLFFIEDTSPLDPHNTFWHTRGQDCYIDLFTARGLRTRVAGTIPTRFGGVKSVFSARKTA